MIQQEPFVNQKPALLHTSACDHSVADEDDKESKMISSQVKSWIQEAREAIPHGGIYKDMRLILNEVLNMQAEDVLGDLERVINACKPLPWEWAQTAVVLLRKAAEYYRDQSAP